VFAAAWASCWKSGVGLIEAPRAERLVRNCALSAASRRSEGGDARRKRWRPAGRHREFLPMLPRMVAVGETTALGRTLNDLATSTKAVGGDRPALAWSSNPVLILPGAASGFV
jgi:type II secretory pathway component PulF